MIENLEQSLQKNKNETTLSAALEAFLKDYEIIFEVNIFAAKWLKKMELLLGNEKISLWEILQSDPDTFSEWAKKEFKITTLETLRWNTLEISDITELYHYQEKPITAESIQTWWNTFPEWKRQSYSIHISRGIRYQRYREYARILMLQHINTIRCILIWVYWIENIHTTYFCTVDEILNESVNQDIAIVRKNKYLKSNTYDFPNHITARYVQPRMTKNTGVSPGTAKWILVDIETIRNILGPRILKTQILSPNLTQYFDEIVGIISEKWSLLSHLAIIARERGIPVIISNEPW
jgi:phosphohistidine swiveling domain-containing protein